MNDFISAAKNLASHPQDYGWRRIYELFYVGIKGNMESLIGILDKYDLHRPDGSKEHTLTLLGISIKNVSEEHVFSSLVDREGPEEEKLASLGLLIEDRYEDIYSSMIERQNSFTCARRYLVSQVLFSRFFNNMEVGARIADLGTGLGVMPRQLNSQTVFDRFSKDLEWPEGIVDFERIPTEKIFGVDRPPFPDIDWIRSCYGYSTYYDGLFQELIWTLNVPDVRQADVQYKEIDIQDLEKITDFIKKERINAINCCFVLYEMSDVARNEVVGALVNSLASPGMLVSVEPRKKLGGKGCDVKVYLPACKDPFEFATVSDGHFVGYVMPGKDYHLFCEDFLGGGV